jgi:hypothetical protein
MMQSAHVLLCGFFSTIQFHQQNYLQLCWYTQREFTLNFYPVCFTPCTSKIGINLLAQKLLIKCWWNWPLVSFTKFFWTQVWPSWSRYFRTCRSSRSTSTSPLQRRRSSYNEMSLKKTRELFLSPFFEGLAIRVHTICIKGSSINDVT